jgi:tetratricopeptide (TPR) repeat protein
MALNVSGIESTADAAFKQALAYHQESRNAEAQAAYERVLNMQPRHVPALTGLSFLALQSNDAGRAILLTDTILKVDSSNAAAHLIRGHAQVRLEQRVAALASYERACALQPDLAEAHFHLGNVLSGLGRHAEAVAGYERALRTMPHAAEIHNNRGNSLLSLKRYAEAIDSYNQATDAMPQNAEPYFNRGLALFELKRFADALSSYDQAIAIRPAYAEAHLSRGNVLKRLDRPEAALASYARAIELEPIYAEAHCNRGNVQSELGRFDEALASYDEAISIARGYANAHCNRGNLLGDMMRFGEALESFDRAIAVDPEYAQARFCKSLVSLLLGDWESGWRDFEWRWRNEHCISSREKREFSQPLWLGQQSLADRTILLHGEQGLGDIIQFCRYATLVAARGARVILEVPLPLVDLLRSLHGVAQVVPYREALPPFDYFCPLLSLPMAFGTTPATIPAQIPYLRSSEARAKYWRDKLGERTRPRVGLVWSGGVRPDQQELRQVNNRRNIPLTEMAALIHPGLEFYSLQKGEPAVSELAWAKAEGSIGSEFIDFTSELSDFAETAALIEQLDLVISVDTSTAHLAGALGKPVWILNRLDSCWRWFLERPDTPWYPTARIYRQERAYDWTGVLTQVRQDLERLAHSGSVEASRAVSSVTLMPSAAPLMPSETPGRNNRCPCGSGRKFKHCCARRDESKAAPGNVVDRSLRDARRRLDERPEISSAFANLFILAKAGRYQDMEAGARELTVSHPSSGVAWKALGAALQLQGKEALDAQERAARLLPDDAEAQSNLGTALRRRGRLDEAVTCLRRALQIRPDLAEVWNNLGNAERDLGHFDAAVAALREALRLKPAFAKAHNNLGNVLLDLGSLEAAAASYREALKCNANYAEAYTNLGSALRLQGRSAEAQSQCACALALDPNYPAAIALLAHLQSDQGHFAEARAHLDRAIAIDPNCAEAWAALAGLRRMSSSEDAQWFAGAMRTAERAPPHDEIPLRFAIGKYLDDIGDYAGAFESYRRANELAGARRPRHDRALLTAGVDRLIQSRTVQWLRHAMPPSGGSERPTLVVGMPRSGTTLAGQILASHPQVYGAGELPYWNDAAGRCEAACAGIANDDGEAGGGRLLRELAEIYLALLAEAAPDAARVVDKMPANFMFLGLIHAALPQARIIHLTRNPIDACLSIYFQNFGAAHSYANDLEDLAHYYREYRRIMDHWRRTLPEGVILDVPYEQLVENPERWSRTMIGHIGLPWDTRCLDFHDTAGTVRTFSKWQVRQPINSASVERWRHYEKFVGPLRSLLPSVT